MPVTSKEPTDLEVLSIDELREALRKTLEAHAFKKVELLDGRLTPADYEDWCGRTLRFRRAAQYQLDVCLRVQAEERRRQDQAARETADNNALMSEMLVLKNQHAKRFADLTAAHEKELQTQKKAHKAALALIKEEKRQLQSRVALLEKDLLSKASRSPSDTLG